MMTGLELTHALHLTIWVIATHYPQYLVQGWTRNPTDPIRNTGSTKKTQDLTKHGT